MIKEKSSHSRTSTGIWILRKAKKGSNIQRDMTDEKQDAQTILMTPTVLAESRKPTIFRGEPGQGPIKWLKEYQKVPLYNLWDDTMQLANVYFF
ncbi:hypothetical protein TNCT_144321 [Trichonephila clavata]|uniref:Uncharacterized protein n=1 Tax=Trichonephila clavata TaxID=2740835 RepID=A0A8X6J950_TRICU|nr:hypothetical protein TNCT_144321 [Trichonephila clavata]